MSEELIHEPTLHLLLEYIKKHHKLQIYLDLNEFDNFVHDKYKNNKVKTQKIIVKKLRKLNIVEIETQILKKVELNFDFSSPIHISHFDFRYPSLFYNEIFQFSYNTIFHLCDLLHELKSNPTKNFKSNVISLHSNSHS